MRRLDPPLEPQGRPKAGGGARGPGVVVVGVDGSATASRAVSYATGVADRNDALLVVVHARPVPIPAWAGFGLWCAASLEPNEESSVLREAQDAIARGRDKVETELRLGDPALQLCQVAEEYRADVIVVGSSRALRHRLWGSVPARLANVGRWPVVVVP